MEEKLIPAHILFARWFIRIRWVALFILVISNYAVRHLFNISIQEVPIYILSLVLFILNVLHVIILSRITKKGSSKVILGIKQEIHFQIITDLINSYPHHSLFRRHRKSIDPLLFPAYDNCKLHIFNIL